jgi:hypothetical protein
MSPGKAWGRNRRFGVVLTVVCGLLYAQGLWRGVPAGRWLAAAVVFGAITLAMPRILRPVLSVWMRFGGLLHHLLSPVMLALFYFGAVLPIGLALRLLGKDLLRLRRDETSYWIERRPPGPEPRTMTEVY